MPQASAADVSPNADTTQVTVKMNKSFATGVVLFNDATSPLGREQTAIMDVISNQRNEIRYEILEDFNFNIEFTVTWPSGATKTHKSATLKKTEWLMRSFFI